ncbi:MAG: transposase, partial [Vallitaleaceae bacterium]|nr:transposase [Vallitaleaceae bacterium]
QENTRKSFVQIPLHILVKQIEYKGRLAGIHVCLEEESYTSGVSAYNQEPITRMYYNEKRRVKRGLFVTTEGKLVNSDTNGSLNIMRKYVVREEIRNVVPILVKQWRDNGCMDHPVRLAVI